jgi:AraC-like DNA-binding protein
MILNYNTIDLFDQRLFTWFEAKTPVQTTIELPPSACFAYVIDGENQYLSKEANIKAEQDKVILSLCATTAGHMLAKEPGDQGRISAMVVHFQKDVLTRIFENSAPPFWKELDKPVVKYIVQEAASDLVRNYFQGLTPIFRNVEAVTEDLLILKLNEILLLLLKTPNSEPISQIMRSLFSKREFTFKEIVDAHICEPLTLEHLAALTNHSLSSFKREFKRVYGATPGSYIIKKRIEKVAEQLKYSDESINIIGYECGFKSPSHLTRVFKSRYAMTPKEYRLQALH